MKKLTLTILALMCTILAWASDHVIERTFLSTDKSVYVAGDRIWVSAFCMDAASGRTSECSSILYLELADKSGTAQTAKIALVHGRGAGFIEIPKTVATGNYLLVPYTSLNVNESAYDYESCARLISVFNPYTTDRNLVRMVKEEEYRAESGHQITPEGEIELVLSQDSAHPHLTIENHSELDGYFSVSIYHLDGINEPRDAGVREFKDALKHTGDVTYTGKRIPEYEGEIIMAKLDPQRNSNDRTVSLAAPGRMTDVYFAPTYGRDTVVFYTGNIYGNKDMVCDLDVEIISPFVNPQVSDIPQLAMCPVTGQDIYERGAASQIENMFITDTLFEMLPVRTTPLLNAETIISYNLDNYTRFPKMEEVFVELIPDLRVRKVDGKPYIQVLVCDNEEGRQFSNDRALMLVDGVPVSDHSLILSYDPMLVKTIEIYPNSYYVGYRSFAGIVNFKTYKGNMPGLVFEDGVRIVNYHGAALPVSYSCKHLATGSIPDFRQTIYWHPSVKLAAGESEDIDYILPDYNGSFRVVIRGFSSNGSPIFRSAVFTTGQ